MTASKTRIRVRHKASQLLLADGPLGWGITPFECNISPRSTLRSTDSCSVTNIRPSPPSPFAETVEKLFVTIAVNMQGKELCVVQFAKMRFSMRR